MLVIFVTAKLAEMGIGTRDRGLFGRRIDRVTGYMTGNHLHGSLLGPIRRLCSRPTRMTCVTYSTRVLAVIFEIDVSIFDQSGPAKGQV